MVYRSTANYVVKDTMFTDINSIKVVSLIGNIGCIEDIAQVRLSRNIIYLVSWKI